MFPRKLHEHVPPRATTSSTALDAVQQDIARDYESHYEISDSGYGKDSVKLLHVQRHGPLHNIKEFEVNTHLKLFSNKDYLHGDNSDIIATDSQKNTVYLLAKQHGVRSAEEFGVLLVRHFLGRYAHVAEAHVYVEEYPWQRVNYDRHQQQQHRPSAAQPQRPSASGDHNHAFVFTPVARRFCDVLLKRNEGEPVIISGLKNMRVLKTTRSSFQNFIADEYRTLPDAADRLFSTNIRSSWQYIGHTNIDFDRIWERVKQVILESFGGDPIDGVPSPSVQNTIYLTQREILRSIPEISTVNIEMPNIHYFAFDTSKHGRVLGAHNAANNQDVFHPVDKPSGIIFAQLKRKNLLSKL